jgi:glutathione S-transferase
VAGFAEQLERLEAALAVRSWLGGGEYGLADIAYVPWVLRARDMLGVSFEPYPALTAWVDRLLEHPAVVAEAELVAAL